MHEDNHVKHRYTGATGEHVTVNVTAHSTTHMVNYTLDGETGDLPAGTPLEFDLGQSGETRRLQLTMDFNAEGSYDITITSVVDCTAGSSPGTCEHSREGPPRVIENYRFKAA